MRLLAGPNAGASGSVISVEQQEYIVKVDGGDVGIYELATVGVLHGQRDE